MMLSFSQFLAESGNFSYPYAYAGNKYVHDGVLEHSYKFDAGGERYDAYIQHNHENPSKSHVVFTGTKSNYDISNSQGHKAVKVFSTVKNIMAYHTKHHPEIKHFSFTSDKSDPSRGSLYAKGTKKLGGTNDSSKAYENHHVIPSHALGEPTKNPTNHFEV